MTSFPMTSLNNANEGDTSDSLGGDCISCASDDSRDSIIDRIFDNNRKWVRDQVMLDRNYFDDLSNGQTPEILYIGCSDSRVTAEQIMGLKPGDAFIHRNIANMVLSLDLSSGCAITYAVKYLKVKHVVVCGHYNCGGVKASMLSDDLGLLNPYLRCIRDVYRIHKDELNAIKNIELRYNRLAELNVHEQVINVLKTSTVQIAFQAGELKVHGWVFDMSTGKLIDLKIDAVTIMDGIREIYKITP